MQQLHQWMLNEMNNYPYLRLLVLFFIISCNNVYSETNVIGLKVNIFKGIITLPSKYILRNDEAKSESHFFYSLGSDFRSSVIMGLKNENYFSETPELESSTKWLLIDKIEKEDFLIKIYKLDSLKSNYAISNEVERVLIFDDKEYIEILDTNNSWKVIVDSYNK